MILFGFLVAINLFKIILAPQFPLIGDEAYYWLWGQHLDLSYVDHPPLIAYVNFMLNYIFGPSEIAIRLTAILLVLLISWLIYLTGRDLYGRRGGLIAVVVFNLLPTFFGGGLFLVPQLLLFFCWSLSFYLLVKIGQTGRGYYWYLLGISAGLGLLSDYVMVLFLAGTLLYFLVQPELRRWFARLEPYLAILLALIIFSPVLIWNARLGFAPLFYWGGKMGAGPRVADNLLNFFGLQPLLYTPLIFGSAIYLIFKAKRQYSLLKIFSAVVFLPFALISPFINVGGHWLATAYLPAVIDTARGKRWYLTTIIIFALLVNSLGFAYYLFLYPTPQELKGKELTINRQLPQYLKAVTPQPGKTYYLANDLGLLGLIAFHGRVKVNMAPGRLRQVDLWGRLKLQPGDNVIYFIINETPLEEKLRPLFATVNREPGKHLFNKDADLPNKTMILICRDYLGQGSLP